MKGMKVESQDPGPFTPYCEGLRGWKSTKQIGGKFSLMIQRQPYDSYIFGAHFRRVQIVCAQEHTRLFTVASQQVFMYLLIFFFFKATSAVGNVCVTVTVMAGMWAKGLELIVSHLILSCS